jgi:hypothetical protein
MIQQLSIETGVWDSNLLRACSSISLDLFTKRISDELLEQIISFSFLMKLEHSATDILENVTNNFGNGPLSKKKTKKKQVAEWFNDLKDEREDVRETKHAFDQELQEPIPGTEMVTSWINFSQDDLNKA